MVPSERRERTTDARGGDADEASGGTTPDDGDRGEPAPHESEPTSADVDDESAADDQPADTEAAEHEEADDGGVEQDEAASSDQPGSEHHEDAPTVEAGSEQDEVVPTDEADPDADDVATADESVLDEDGAAGGDVEPAGSRSDRDDNVVSLFRDRAVPAGADDGAGDEAAGHGGADEDGADEVGGIFARLRDELPASDTVVATEPEPAGTASDDSTPAEAAEPADVDAVEDTEDVAAEDTAFTRRDEALVPLIVSAARKIKRVLADEQNVVLDRLRQKEPVTALADLVPETDDHAATYRSAIDDELVGAAAAGAVETGASDTRTLRNRLGRAGALDDATALIRTALIGPLRDRLERSIADGAGDNEAITKRVRAVYREWKTQHIDTQLDDVFRFAHGGGIAVTVEPGSPMVWTIDPAQAACPDCEDNSLSGAVPAGEPFPTGHTAAPAHPGCHCLVLPAE